MTQISDERLEQLLEQCNEADNDNEGNTYIPVFDLRALLAAREREQGLREACKAARIQLGGLCQAIGEYCDGSDADVLNMLDAVLETGGPT
jgi:hypothetical protein